MDVGKYIQVEQSVDRKIFYKQPFTYMIGIQVLSKLGCSTIPTDHTFHRQACNNCTGWTVCSRIQRVE